MKSRLNILDMARHSIGGHGSGEVVIAVRVAVDARVCSLEDEGVGIGLSHKKHLLQIN